MATLGNIRPHVGCKTKQERYKRINDLKRQNQRIYIFNVNKKYDKDVIGWLENNKPYQAAIKWLVREQIKKEEASADIANLKESLR